MENCLYHILNRGVEKKKIFLSDKDYTRFVHNLHDFNRQDINIFSYSRRQSLSAMRWPTDKKSSVDVLCWCLMPNHFHILTIEKIDNGVSDFSKRITGGYTQYFNLRNKRSGVLFQGRSKIIPIQRDEHFLHLPFYIFSNPIKLIEPCWKEKGFKKLNKVIQFLENYKWSGYSDIIGRENFPFIINKKLFFEIFDTSEKRFKKDFSDLLSDYVGHAMADMADNDN